VTLLKKIYQSTLPSLVGCDDATFQHCCNRHTNINLKMISKHAYHEIVLNDLTIEDLNQRKCECSASTR
jgi:hypothetical protein